MPNPIVDLVEDEMRRFEEDRAANRDLFPTTHQAPVLYPVPFFGDIRQAEVLTLALNPSWTEFHAERSWILGLNPQSLTTRLLHYFDLPEPLPHKWFAYRRTALSQLSSSYEKNAAHIDLLSHPTKLRRHLGDPQRRIIGRLIEAGSESRLIELLQLATRARVILVKDYCFSKSNGEATNTINWISKNPAIAEQLRLRGIQLLELE